MQQDPLISLGNLQGVTDFGGIQPLDVPHRDDGLLRRRKLPQRLLQNPQRLAAQERRFGRVILPSPGRREPLSFRGETVRLDGGLVFPFLREHGECDHALVTNRPSLGPIDEDAEEPGLQARSRLEGGNTAENREPCLLSDLLGGSLVGDEETGEPNQAHVVALDEQGKRLLIFGEKAPQQSSILRIRTVRHFGPPVFKQYRISSPPTVTKDRLEGHCQPDRRGGRGLGCGSCRKLPGTTKKRRTRMRAGKAFGAGVTGAVVMSIVMAIARAMGMQVKLELMLGTMFGSPPSPGTWALGFVIHLMMGGLFGLLYAVGFEHVAHRAGVWVGAGFGLVHALGSGLALAMVSSVHPLISAGQMPAPGAFMSGLGMMGVVAFVMLHLIYGGIVGGMYGSVATAPAAELA